MKDELRLSERIENIRDEITKVRSHLHDATASNDNWRARVKPVEGLLTCGLISLHSLKEELVKFEVFRDDIDWGSSLPFRSRGLGLDSCPCCFVCGAGEQEAYLNNIAAFVDSQDHGREIVSWFPRGASLDYREYEKEWIQVKVGACDAHVRNLKHLSKATSRYGVIREWDIKAAIALPPEDAE